MPFGFHLTMDTLPSRVLRNDYLWPARHYPRFRIWHPSSGHQRDFNPPELRAAQRTLCLLLTSPWYSAPISQRPASNFRSTREISRGKARHFRCASAGFTKYIPAADGGLRGHVPARPGCTTPHIRFLFIAPQLWVQLPPDPASRQRPCRFPSLRLCENLAGGLPPP